jgi:hypothetical protein
MTFRALENEQNHSRYRRWFVSVVNPDISDSVTTRAILVSDYLSLKSHTRILPPIVSIVVLPLFGDVNEPPFWLTDPTETSAPTCATWFKLHRPCGERKLHLRVVVDVNTVPV